MKKFLRSPIFWLFFTSAALIASGLTWYLFPKAYPIINLSITMDRAQAVTATQQFANDFKVGPCDCLYAVSFNTEEMIKTFVELEAGGKDALVAMMDKKLYLPYTWTVRQFKPFDQHQLYVQFTPDGAPYGFFEILSQEADGTSITPPEAQKKAEAFATAAPWNIDLKNYKLVETSQEATPKKRIDHTFTYERTDHIIGEGFYRLKLVVSGDHVTRLSHSVKVPDAFNRRYAQMRSANANIAYLANLAMLLLYVIGCCLFGLIYLYRRQWLIWQTPLYWGIFVAFLVALNTINKLPLSWMEYNTSISPFGFLLEHGISMLYSFIFMSLILSMIFIAAESLTRRAFGHQIQLWHMFGRSVASSPTILGYTITGYFLVPIMLCYTMIFTVVTMRFAGWWIPSSSLFNPDILATYFPWLESISLSLQAGFMEECLFRAIPLATAALLGDRFGKRNWFIAIAFILQAVIFGAAHANYPAQPAYARLVELLADSALFGAVYLKLGLLPAIIAHFIYDVFWFGIPIFVANSFSAHINTVIILLLSILPLLIILIARLRNGTWIEIPLHYFNSAWYPVTNNKPNDEEIITLQERALSHGGLSIALMLALIGAGSWFFYTPFTPVIPPFKSSRTTVQDNALRHLQEKSIPTEHWYPVTFCFPDFTLNPDVSKRHHFVWQTAGNEIYRELIGSYLMPAYWITRLLQYNGSVMERAEEYQLFTLPNGTLIRTVHKIPETTPGATIEKAEALVLAQKTIESQFAIAPQDLHEISAVAEKHPARLDWTVTYSTSSGLPLPEGEKRIIVTIAGDQIVDAYRTVYIPESWERAYENRQMFSKIIAQVCQLLIYLIAVIGALIALLQWRATTTISVGALFLLISAIFLFELGNSWPSVIANFNTSQPFIDQLFRSFSIPAIMLIIKSAALAIMFSFVTYTRTHFRYSYWWQSVIGGIGIGLAFAGLKASLAALIPSTAPVWPNVNALRFALPIIAGIDSLFLHTVSLTIFLLLALIAINRITHYGTRNSIQGVIACLVIGFIGAGLLHANNLMLCAVAGICYGLFFAIAYYTLACNDRSMIPIIVNSFLLTMLAHEIIYNSYNGALISWIGCALIVTVVSAWWSRKLYKAS